MRRKRHNQYNADHRGNEQTTITHRVSFFGFDPTAQSRKSEFVDQVAMPPNHLRPPSDNW
jgi:hypothetical protein